MIARAYTVAFQGVDARLIEVQCSLAPGIPAFNIVYSNKYKTKEIVKRGAIMDHRSGCILQL